MIQKFEGNVEGGRHTWALAYVCLSAGDCLHFFPYFSKIYDLNILNKRNKIKLLNTGVDFEETFS